MYQRVVTAGIRQTEVLSNDGTFKSLKIYNDEKSLYICKTPNADA